MPGTLLIGKWICCLFKMEVLSLEIEMLPGGAGGGGSDWKSIPAKKISGLGGR